MFIEENTIARRALSAFLSAHGVELRPDVEVSNWDLMIKLAEKGMGVGCVPREYCAEQLEKGSLCVLNTLPALPVRGVGIAVRKNAQIPYALKQFLKLFP